MQQAAPAAAPEAPPSSGGNYGAGLTRMFAQGATFGFADEVEAGLRAMAHRQPGEDFETAYYRNRDTIRDGLDAFRKENPWTSAGMELAGGVLVPGLGTVGTVGRFIGGGASTLARVGRGALVGAGEGALYGAGVAEEAEDIPGSAVQGAALGGAVGSAVPAAAAGLRTLRGALRPEAGANARLARAFQRDDTSLGEVGRKLQEARGLGRPATIADVAGESVRRELETAAQSPGRATNLIEQFMERRNKDMLRRISDDFAGMAGGVSGDEVAEIINRTERARVTASAPVYRQAMNFQAELSDDIVSTYNYVVSTPLGKQALGKAKKILNLGVAREKVTEIVNAGTPNARLVDKTIERDLWNEAPLMERIDALKKGLDDVIGVAKRKGENQIARSGLQLLRNDAGDGLLDLVDAANPRYRQAREIWSTKSAYLDAINEGRDIMKHGFTATQLKMKWRDLGDAEREAFRIGAVDAIITRMRNEAAKEPNLMKIIRSPEMMDKITAMMPMREAQEFRRLVELEDDMFSTAAQALRGSPTARRLAQQAEAARQAQVVGILESILGMTATSLRGIFTKAIPSLTRGVRDTLLARQNEAIARIALMQSPDALQPIARAAARPPGAMEGRLLPGGVAGSVGVNAAPE